MADHGRMPVIAPLKAWAIGLVVLLHASAPAAYAFGRIGAGEWWLANIVDSLCRTAVPLFVMASGATLLDPAKTAALGTFFRRRVAKVVVPLLIWSAIYVAWSALVQHRAPEPAAALRDFLAGGVYYHLLFVTVILNLYLVAPILAPFADGASPASRAYALAIWIALASAVPAFSAWTGIPFAWGPTGLTDWVGYFLAGRLLRDIVCDARASLLLVLAILALVAVTAAATYAATLRQGALDEFFYVYGRPNIALTTLASFLLLNAAPLRRWYAAHPAALARIETVAACSFGIYLVHPLALESAAKLGLSSATFHAALGIPLTAACVFLVSFAIVRLLRLWPATRIAVP